MKKICPYCRLFRFLHYKIFYASAHYMTLTGEHCALQGIKAQASTLGMLATALGYIYVAR